MTVGYTMNIHCIDLQLPAGKEETVDNTETFLGWFCFRHPDNGPVEVEPVDSYFEWDDDFIADLKFLQSLGVCGDIILYGQEGEYEKYVLNDASVKKFRAILTFEKTPIEEF